MNGKPNRTQRAKRPLRRDNPLDALDSSLLAKNRQCRAQSKRTGEQCKRMCAPGLRTCNMHGSSTKRAKIAASKRIAEASGYAAEMLVEFMADPAVPVKDRTQIAQDLLTRAGIAGKQQLEIGMQTVSEVYANIVLGSTVPVRRNDAGEWVDVDVLDAEVVEDDDAEPDVTPQELEDDERVLRRDRLMEKRRRSGKQSALPPSQAARYSRKPPKVDIEEDPRSRPEQPSSRAERRREYEAELLRRDLPRPTRSGQRTQRTVDRGEI